MTKKRILIVEDSPETHLALRIRLQKEGYVTLSAYNGEEGLKMAREERPDLIILDVMLPLMDGFTVCRLLKFDKKYEDIPILILTARSSPNDRQMSIKVKADAFMTKPFRFKQLIGTVERLLNGNSRPFKISQATHSYKDSTRKEAKR